MYAGNYRKDHPHLDSFMDGAESEAWTRALEILLADRPRVMAVDLGCGDGRTLGRWQRKVEKNGWTERVQLWGTDLSPKMIEAARGRIKGPKWGLLDLGVPAEVKAWREANGPADLVSAFFLLVHFDQPDQFFAGVAGLSAPGTRLVLNTIPQPSAPELRASGKPIMIEAWDHTVEEVSEAGRLAGFELTASQDYTEKEEVISTLMEWVYRP